MRAADLLAYLAGGHVKTVTQSVGGAEYEEAVAISACVEAKILEVATAAVLVAPLWAALAAITWVALHFLAG